MHPSILARFYNTCSLSLGRANFEQSINENVFYSFRDKSYLLGNVRSVV